jgi:2-amino-4-hydroxy-6-hydroxymethyldihydropteridine diphosphokinase
MGTPQAASHVYRNPALGSTPQPDFLNAAVLLTTSSSPGEIRGQLRQIEHTLGRRRTLDKYAPRTIDLDLCLLGILALENEEMVLPEPDLLTRPHLAVPMAELDPHFTHPEIKKDLAAIATDLAPHHDLELLPDFSIRFMKAFLDDEHHS